MTKLCKEPNCTEPVSAKLLCRRHYARVYNAIYQRTPEYKLKQKSIKPRLQTARSHAERRNIEWDITLEEFKTLSELPCHYCKRVFSECGSGLDRKNAKGPYSLANVVPCCGKCNFLKGRYLTVDEMCAVVDVLKQMRGGIVWSID